MTVLIDYMRISKADGTQVLDLQRRPTLKMAMSALADPSSITTEVAKHLNIQKRSVQIAITYR